MIKRKQHKYHKIWNDHHPDDPILPGDGNVIHHKDFDYSNDDPNNLQKMKAFDHLSLHKKGNNHYRYGKKLPDELKKKISESLKGSSNPMFNKHHSKETKHRISEKKRGENHHNSKLTWSTVEWIRDILNSEEYREAKAKKLISQKQLAALFGIKPQNIYNIRMNKIWIKEK
ncbi:MAG: NUMOD3 domain-containing DNA-binding protein [Candidatus Thorarchaeota archaeon]